MNIYDISEKAGVSIATVSRVLNNSEKVSEKTRLKINAIIEENGYTPVKRQSRKNNTVSDSREVGILCSSVANTRAAIRIDSLLKELRRYNYTPITIACGDDYNEKRLAFDYLLDRKVNAVIVDGDDFFGFNPAENDYISGIATRMPVILMNTNIEGANIYCILCDRENSIHTLTEDAIKKEHSKILYLFPSMSSSNMNLLDSFKEACLVHNIEQPSEYIHLCANGNSDAYEYMNNLIETDNAPQTVICVSENLAAGAVHATLRAGLTIPTDIEFICLGASDISFAIPTPLTVIDSRDEELGRITASTLISIMNSADTASRTIIPSEITVIHN